MLRIFAALPLLVIVFSQAQLNIAYFPISLSNNPDALPEGFLDRISNSGYTHIVLNVIPVSDAEWSGGEYQCPVDPRYCGVVSNYRSNFLRVGQWNKKNQKNIKIIPYFGLSNKHAAAYGVFNPAIKFNVWEEYQGKDKAFKEFGLGVLAKKTPLEKGEKCPAYLKNPEYHKTVKSLEKTVFQAYREAVANPMASLDPKLEYVHLGFDEMYTEKHHSLSPLEKLGFGNSNDDFLEMNLINFKRFMGVSNGTTRYNFCHERWRNGTVPNPPDNLCELWISPWDYSNVALWARHELLLNELGAQIDNAKSASSAISDNPASNAKFIVWGDIWDPQKAGGYFGFSQFIGELAARFGNSIVVAPWQYTSFYQSPMVANVDIDIKVEGGTEIGGQIKGDYVSTGHPYDAAAALSAFTSKGLKVVFCSALKFGYDKIDFSSLRQVYNYSKACKANPNCIGRVAGIYPGVTSTAAVYDPLKGPYDQEPYYGILELLDVVSRRNSEVKTLKAILATPNVRQGYMKFPGISEWKSQSAVNGLLTN